MLEKSFSLNFYLKDKKNVPDNMCHVFLKLTINGESSVISLKLDWSKDRWNKTSGKAEGKQADAVLLNEYLESVRIKVMHARLKLLDEGKEVTAGRLKNLLLGQDDENKKLLEVFRLHNDKMASLIGIEFAPGTMERYKTSYDHTYAYIKWKYGKEDIEIRKLDYEFISDYQYWFKSVRKCSHNTTVKYLANMKKIVLDCVKKGWLQRDPFLDFKMVKKDIPREALTESELDHVSKKIFSTQRLNLVRDLFIFSCYTGLAYIDVKNLDKNQIIQGMDGEKWLFTHRQKTNSPTRLPLLPQAMKILVKYQDHPKAEISGKVLPTPSNQKLNAYLKEIADLCGINKELTFHIARHTFATTVTLANGVPIETVSKMLGHKSLSQTQHYAKILDTTVSHEMKALREKLENQELIKRKNSKKYKF